MKTCSSCNESKSRSEFWRNRSSADGLQSRCKDCLRAYSARWYRENRERHRANGRAYYQKNRGHVLAKNRRWTEENRDRHSELNRRWKQSNRDKMWEYKHRYRSRLSETRVASINRHEIWSSHGGKCHICGLKVAESAMELDHLVPISAGGDHIPENLAPAHMSCNRSRGPSRIPAQLRLVA